MDSRACKIFKVISVVLFVLLGISGYFDYQYYKIIKANNDVQNSYYDNFAAKVTSIDNNSLILDTGVKQITIKTDKNTVFSKIEFNPQGEKIENIKFSDIKTGMSVNVSLNSKNKQLADKCNVIVQNIIAGKATNITDNQISVDFNGQVSEVSLTADTKYYLDNIPPFNPETGTNIAGENTVKLSEINKDQVKTGSQVIYNSGVFCNIDNISPHLRFNCLPQNIRIR